MTQPDEDREAEFWASFEGDNPGSFMSMPDPWPLDDPDGMVFHVHRWLGVASLATEKVAADQTVFRLLWHRSFSPGAVIRLERHNDRSVLHTTVITESATSGRSTVSERRMHAIEDAQWKHFLRLVDTARFRELPQGNGQMGLDGDSWVLEERTRDLHHLVHRWSPGVAGADESFRVACRYLIDLAGVDPRPAIMTAFERVLVPGLHSRGFKGESAGFSRTNGEGSDQLSIVFSRSKLQLEVRAARWEFRDLAAELAAAAARRNFAPRKVEWVVLGRCAAIGRHGRAKAARFLLAIHHLTGHRLPLPYDPLEGPDAAELDEIARDVLRLVDSAGEAYWRRASGRTP